MSPQHRQAIETARVENKAVGNYLKVLNENPVRRGPRRTPERIRARIGEINASVNSASPIKRVSLIQERRNLEQSLKAGQKTVDTSHLERDFVKYASAFSSRKGIGYGAWREMGVPASVLKQAGINRGAAK